MDIICVVLGCDTKNFRTTDSIKLIEYAFKNFEYVNIEDLVNKNLEEWKNQNQNPSLNQNYFEINKSKNSNLEIIHSPLDVPIMPVLKTDISSITVEIEISKNFEAPILPNTIIGGILVSSNNNFLAYSNILTNNTISKKEPFDYFKEFFKII